MAVTALGAEKLSELMERSCRIVLANDSDSETGAMIVSAVFVLHREDESTETLCYYGLDVGPDESSFCDTERPAVSPVVFIEAVLKISPYRQPGLINVYATASEQPPQPLHTVTVGIRSHEGVLTDEDRVISEMPDVAVFGRPA